MKKTILCLIVLLCCTVFTSAVPSGELDNFDEEDNYKKQGIYNLIKGIPIKYFYKIIEEEDNKSLSQEDILDKKISSVEYEKLIEDALKAWPLQTAEFIKNSARADEFADILPVLSAVKTQKVISADMADVEFRFSSVDYIKTLPQSKNSCALTSDFQIPIVINIPDIKSDISQDKSGCFARYKNVKDNCYVLALHESGHYYALADQYSYENASPLYSNSDRINRKSIMGASYQKNLTCDDVDGFIKLADRTFYKINNKYTERDLKGWKSFCDDTFYVKGKVQNRQPYFYKWEIYKYTPQGDISEDVNIYNFIFSDDKVQTVKNEHNGLPEKAIDSKNNIYIKYSYSNADNRPKFSACAYFLDNDTKLDCAEFNKDTDGNFWDMGNYKLFITDNTCRFSIESNVSVNVYTGPNPQSFKWDFSYDGDDNSRITVKKFDYQGDNFKCEYIDSDPVKNITKSYLFEYKAKEDTFSFIKNNSSVVMKETTLKQFKDICIKEPDYFSAMHKNEFNPVCNFLRQVENGLNQ